MSDPVDVEKLAEEIATRLHPDGVVGRDEIDRTYARRHVVRQVTPILSAALREQEERINAEWITALGWSIDAIEPENRNAAYMGEVLAEANKSTHEALRALEAERDGLKAKLGDWAYARYMGQLLGSSEIPGGVSYAELEADAAVAHKRAEAAEARLREAEARGWWSGGHVAQREPGGLDSSPIALCVCGLAFANPIHRPPDARPAEPPADPPTCCCGNPLSLGVVHRLDGPCWIPADDQIPPSSEGPCPCGRPDRNHTHLREGR